MSKPATDSWLRQPHLTDIVELAARMRAADRAECSASGFDDVRHAVELSVEHSTWARTVVYGGRVMCIGGVGPAGADATGVPWALGTDVVTEHPHGFVRWGRVVIAHMLALYPRLVNHVHADNVFAVRWLQRAGFVIEPAAPFGPRGALFHRFEMRT